MLATCGNKCVDHTCRDLKGHVRRLHSCRCGAKWTDAGVIVLQPTTEGPRHLMGADDA